MQRFLDSLGKVLFRLRSFLPLPLIYLVMRQSWDSHVVAGPGGREVDEVLNVLGVLTCAFGAGIRFVTVGLAPRGTSSQSRVMQAPSLTTEGTYSVVRHPLYLGNFFITLGLLLVAHEPWAYAVGLGYWALSHLLMARAEEQLLIVRFGEPFLAWRGQVPAWVPKPSLWKRGAVSFQWKRAIQREVNPLVAWGLGATLLLLWERFVRGQLPGPLGRQYLTVAAVFLVLLIANKVWKKVSRA